MRIEIKIAGFGGQGIVTLSVLIVSGINLYTDKFAVQTEAYGPQARGGDCWAEAVIDDNEIDYPQVIEPDYAILLSQTGFNAYANEVKPGGFIFLDPDSVSVPKNFKDDVILCELAAARIALNEFGTKVVANTILFSAFNNIAKIFNTEIARKVICDNVPDKALDLNLKAFDRGLDVVF